MLERGTDLLPSGKIEFRLLGALEVMVDGRSVPLTKRQGALCTALLLQVNHVVSVDRLIHRLWDERPPVAAAARVRALIMDLRRSLGPGAESVVVTRSPGYMIKAEPSCIDIFEFDRLVEAGVKAARLGLWDMALREYERALALWRGEPFAVLPWASERYRLEELGTAAMEGRLEAQVELGLGSGTIAELTKLVAEYPLRERPRALLMRAFHQEGRTAEALTVYASFRRELIDAMGLEPSVELSTLHRQVLSKELPTTADPVGNRPDPSGRADKREPVAPRPPHQIRAVTSLFGGREDELRQLDELHRRGEPVVMITGPAGAGKSTLAARWAQLAAHDFPDGQLFLDMRGFARGKRRTLEEAVSVLLQGLGCAPRAVPLTLDAQMALYQTMVADRRMLLILDDVADPAQVRDLLPGAATTMTLVTSRDRLTGLAATNGARRVACDVLAPAESAILIGRAVGASRVAAEPDAVARLADLCDHLPLALCVAVAQIAEDEAVGAIERFTAKLSDGDRLARLQVDGDEDIAVRTALDLSYRMLGADARAVFRSIGLLPGSGRSPAALAAGAGLSEAQAGQALQALARVHLLRPTVTARAGWHALVHTYAVELLRKDDPDQRQAATRRVLDHYLSSAARASAACGYAVPCPRPDGDTTLTLELPDPAAAHAWFDQEWEDIAIMIGRLAEQGPHRYAWLLLDALKELAEQKLPLSELARVTEAALRGARIAGDPAGQAAMYLILGRTRWRATDHQAALAEYAQAGRLARLAGWPIGQAHAAAGTGIVLKLLGRQEDAMVEHQRAASIYHDAGDERGEAACLSNVASAYISLGRLREAGELLAEALPQARRHDRHLRALVLVNLGLIRQRQGRWAQALTAADEAIRVTDEMGTAYTQALAFEIAGYAHAGAGHPEQAAESFQTGLALAQRAENVNCQTACLVGLADASWRAGLAAEAEKHLGDARERADRVGAAEALTLVLIAEAAMSLELGRPGQSLEALDRAGPLAAEGGPIELPRVQLLRARALAALGDTERAFAAARDACRLADESDQRPIHASALETLADLHAATGAPGTAAAAREHAAAIRRELS